MDKNFKVEKYVLDFPIYVYFLNFTFFSQNQNPNLFRVVILYITFQIWL